jgi:hypothetical protein
MMAALGFTLGGIAFLVGVMWYVCLRDLRR